MRWTQTNMIPYTQLKTATNGETSILKNEKHAGRRNSSTPPRVINKLKPNKLMGNPPVGGLPINLLLTVEISLC